MIPQNVQERAIRTTSTQLRFPTCSQKEQERIADLLKIFDEANLFTLGLKTPRLIEIGQQITDLHPLSFLQTVLTDSTLRIRLQRIFNSSVKRMGFLYGDGFNEGFVHKLEKEQKKGGLELYADSFARSLHLSPDEIRQLMQKRSWKSLMVHLIEKTGAPKQGKCPA